jgi:hypothetical protein
VRRRASARLASTALAASLAGLPFSALVEGADMKAGDLTVRT